MGRRELSETPVNRKLPDSAVESRFYTPDVVIDDIIHWFHLLAATVWIGGMITVAAVVPVLRSAGVERKQLQLMARRFGVVSWTAMLVSVATGVTQVLRLDVALSAALAWKITLVGVAISIAFVHQQAARHVGPALRGVMEAALLVVGLAILAAAVAL